MAWKQKRLEVTVQFQLWTLGLGHALTSATEGPGVRSRIDGRNQARIRCFLGPSSACDGGLGGGEGRGEDGLMEILRDVEGCLK